MLTQCVKQGRAGIEAKAVSVAINLKFNRYGRRRRLGIARVGGQRGLWQPGDQEACRSRSNFQRDATRYLVTYVLTLVHD
jgi:hypothetical protein